MTVPAQERTKVFISYSHEDAEWLRRLRVHLKPLARQYDLDIWDDTRITAGAKWREEIERSLASAKVAVLLISAYFLGSDFIAKDELPPLLAAAEKEGTVILPVILSHSRFSRIPELYQFQAVNDPKNPLDGLSKTRQEQVLVSVTEAIEAALGYSPSSEPEEGVPEGATDGTVPQEEPEDDGEVSHADGAPPPRRAKPKRWPAKHPTISVALIGGLGILLAAYWLYRPAPSFKDGEQQYTGRVTDAATSKPVHNAQVSVEEDQQVPQVRGTDSAGIFSVMLRQSTKAIRVRVEADDYQVYERYIPLPRTGIEDIKLRPLDVVPPLRPTPTPQPTASPPGKIKVRPTSPQQRCTQEDILLGRDKGGRPC